MKKIVVFSFSEEEQDILAKLALARNRLAHRYLNFRWQAVSMYMNQQRLISRLLTAILEQKELWIN